MLHLALSEKQRDSSDLVFFWKFFLHSQKIRSMTEITITMTKMSKDCYLLEEFSVQFQDKETIL